MHEFSYFREVLGDSYTPTFYGQHEGTHPARVREVLAEFKGTKAADVIAALVKEQEISRQRYNRLLAENQELIKAATVGSKVFADAPLKAGTSSR